MADSAQELTWIVGKPYLGVPGDRLEAAAGTRSGRGARAHQADPSAADRDRQTRRIGIANGGKVNGEPVKLLQRAEGGYTFQACGGFLDFQEGDFTFIERVEPPDETRLIVRSFGHSFDAYFFCHIGRKECFRFSWRWGAEAGKAVVERCGPLLMLALQQGVLGDQPSDVRQAEAAIALDDPRLTTLDEPWNIGDKVCRLQRFGEEAADAADRNCLLLRIDDEVVPIPADQPEGIAFLVAGSVLTKIEVAPEMVVLTQMAPGASTNPDIGIRTAAARAPGGTRTRLERFTVDAEVVAREFGEEANDLEELLQKLGEVVRR